MPDSGEVWIVGRSFWELEPSGDWSWTWDFHGVFSNRECAAALCENEHWFIVPITVDQPIPNEPQEFPNLVVPNNSKAEPLRHKRSGR